MAEDDATTAAVGENPVPPVVTGEPVEVANGVFVVPDGLVPLVPNIGIVVGDRAALVVDTAMGPRNGEIVRAMAERLGGGRPLIVTSTHFHPEHGFGAQAFPQAQIVCNRSQAAELRDKGTLYVEMFRGFGPEVASQLEGVDLVEPTIVYDGECDLDLGGRKAQLRTWGPAHTRGDQVVFLPEERVLFTGDLVENGFFSIFPYFPPDDADVDGSAWIHVLEHLEQLEPEIVVPGHGELGDAALITTARDYLIALRDETRRLAGERLDDAEIVTALEAEFRDRHPGWGASEWIAFGVRAYLAEFARGVEA
jgi:glyoxylase-like metal-dependent hydrolase (beta-lactamase superfamily II)